MIGELRRRAYLSAMQVVSWLPRSALPFAPPSRVELLQVAEPAREELPALPQTVQAAAPQPRPARPLAPVAELRSRLQPSAPAAAPAAVPPEAPVAASQPRPIPRFSLQLYRSGNCLLLVELPNGEAFQSRDPAYLLLKDLLRAAGLPDSPQLLGEPVRWPLLSGGNLDQGAEAARDFLQGYLAARLEEGPTCACLWLVGLPAVRFAGEGDELSYNNELQIDGLGVAWALPGLELLMDEPQRKAGLWRAMQRVRGRWLNAAERPE